jgi:FkbM family methyltransferase
MIQTSNLLKSKKKLFAKFVKESINNYNLIDVGASLPVNKYYTLLNEKFKFYFIEPNKKEVIKLKKFCQNSFSHFVICNNLISSKKKNYFYYYKNYQLNSILRRNKIALFNRSNSLQEVIKKKRVDSVTLEKLIQQNKIETNNCILKIDVQGTAMDVLKSIKKKNFLFPIVLCECDRFMIYKKQSLDFEIIKFMHDNQYLPIGDICRYEWSYYFKKKKKINLS